MSTSKRAPSLRTAKPSQDDTTPVSASRPKAVKKTSPSSAGAAADMATANAKTKKARKAPLKATGRSESPTDKYPQASEKDIIHGKITGLHGDVLQGWALDPRVPELSLAIEIFYDGVFGHLVRADAWVSEPGFAQFESHGFLVRLKSEWLKTTQRITARVANQGPWLEGAIELGNGSAEFPVVYGSQHLYQVSGLRLMGWAAIAQNNPTVLGVRVLHENRVVAQALANRRMAFLKDKPYQGHGFEIYLPWDFADGIRRQLDVVTDDGQPLVGSPVAVCVTVTTHASMAQAAWRSRVATSGSEDRSETVPSQALLSVLAAHERLYPSSFGFSHYPQWCELYQAPPEVGPSSVKCAVLIVSETVKEPRCERSVQSALAQRLPEDQVECLVVKPLALMQALREASSTVDLIVPVLGGDQLISHAVDMMANSLVARANGPSQLTGWGYSDSDVLDDGDTEGQGEAQRTPCRTLPWLKPDWDETLYYGQDYVTPGIYLSSSVVREVLEKCDREGESVSTWSEFLVRVIALDSDPVHLPWVLYHESRSALEGSVFESVASDGSARPTDATQVVGQAPRLSRSNRLLALNWLANQRAPGARVEIDAQGPEHLDRTRAVWPLPRSLPLVSVIIPTRDGFELLQAVTQGLLERTSYSQVELLVVDNESTCPKTLALLRRLKKEGVKIVSYPKPFNYSAINNLAVEQATGELILFLNNDVEIIQPDWLSEMVAQFQRPNVGIVGKKLLWPNAMVQHGGVVVGINGLAAHAFTACQADDPGYQGLNLVDREQSAVTGACLMIRREDFLQVGGFDEYHLPVAFNDVDLCLKLRQLGKKVVITTGYPLIHNESTSRGKEDSAQKMARARRERDNFISRWMLTDKPFHDPYYHSGLNRDYLSGPYAGLGKPSLYE